MKYVHDELLGIFWPLTARVPSGGLRDPALLESAVARPFQSAFGQDIYPTVSEKGIALFHSLVSNHAFVDGNKRTAVTAFDHFLLANGFVLGVSNSMMYQLATQTASYRERGISHEESLRLLAEAMSDLIAPVQRFKSELEGIPALKDSLEATMKLRSWIRRHPMNRLIKSR